MSPIIIPQPPGQGTSIGEPIGGPLFEAGPIVPEVDPPGGGVVIPRRAVSLEGESKESFLARMIRLELEESFMVKLRQLPKEWNDGVAQSVIQNGFEQIVDDIAAKTVDLLIDERTEIDAEIERVEFKPAIPPTDEAIRVGFAQSTTADRWDTETVSGRVYRGPGRIWKFSIGDNVPQLGSGGGPFRYRLRIDDLKFGVLSTRFLDDFSDDLLDNNSQQGSRLEVSYGVILRGIPWPGTSPPRKVTLLEYFQDAPGALIGEIPVSLAWMNGAHNLAEEKATDRYVVSPPIMYESFKDSNLTVMGHNWFAPNDLEPTEELIEGLTLMMITADTPRHVYEQLNSGLSTNMAFVSGNVKGSTASVSEGLEITSPCVNNISVRNNSTGDQLRAETVASIAASANRHIYEGAPIRYDDCGSLAIQDQQFSLLLRPWPSKVIPWTEIDPGIASNMLREPSDDQRLASWHTSGLKVVKENTRETTIDVVIE